MRLTREEQELLESVEKGEWKRVEGFEQEAARYREAARATMRKDKRVNIRMTERDFIHFQKAALREGLPYQTLISSILHKYINGRLVEKAN
ncbi:antitoxin [Desulfonatronum thiodismutans]|uniref:antitoxin n=1 Tax=Desulfonatronum thiodismutans TaxID=159290 RepID=UPI0004ABE4B7|nr:antitoxin [Desulfonatronum thiodismutans]